MGKMNYEFNGNTYSVDRKLVDTWMEREGIREGEPGFHNAMECVIINAEGRLKQQNLPVTKEAMEQAMEDVIKEEIELTGGKV